MLLLPESPAQLPTTLEDAHAVILSQQARITLLEGQVESLQKQLQELAEKLGSSSRTSSKPPSSDSPEQRSQRPKRPGSDRNKGGQPGHTRHERALLPEDKVNQTHTYLPESLCQCGGQVTIDQENPYRHQVFDLPPPPVTVTEHRFYRGVCQSCGRRHQSRWPDWVPSGQMAAGLIAWIALLSGQFRLSMRQIQRLLRELWQLPFSLGAISKAQGKTVDWMGEPYRQVGEYVRSQAVSHADETRHYRGTSSYWLWSLSSGAFSYFMTHYSRGKQAAAALLENFQGILVTDHFAGYAAVPAERRQLCWAHLIRHFRKIAGRRGEGGHIGWRLLLLASAVIRTRHRLQQHPERAQRYRHRLLRLRRRFRQALLDGTQLEHCQRTRNQCLHLLKDEAMCWTFLQDDRISLTNNRAERALRPYVQWRKTSFATQSAQGDRFRPMILTIVGTAQQLGVSSASIMRAICDQGLARQPITVRFPFEPQHA